MTLHHRQTDSSARPILRLVRPDERTLDSSGGLSPLMTLREFFEAWYKPIVLIGQNGDASSTVNLYHDALRYWENLTNNPCICEIDEFVIAHFTEALRRATYRRGKIGEARPLSEWTVNKHLKNIRALLSRVGPTLHPKRPGKRLVEEVPYVAISAAQERLKPGYTLETARKIVAAARDVKTPEIDGIPSWRWWPAVYSVYFFTGLRSSSVFALRWEWLEEREDGHWFCVPTHGVKKTRKAIDVPVHPELLTAILPIRTKSEFVCPRPFCYEHFCTLHDQAQALAGIAPGKRLSPQAWRRTHGQEMVKLGAKFGVRAAQLSLDHADAKTTLGHYVTLADIMRQLPWLADLGHDPRQKQLF